MRKSLKITAWTLGGLAVLLVLLGAVVWVAGNTAAGRAQIEGLTYRLTAGHVRLLGLAGAFPHRLTLEELQLADERGIWLIAKGIELDWSPLAYLSGRLQVNRLSSAEVNMTRLPQSSSTPSRGEVSIPHIDVSQVSIALLRLGPELTGAPASLVAAGSAHLRSLRDMLFDLKARRVDGDGRYDVQLRFDEQRMDAALELHEPADGPLEHILSLPGLGELQATLDLHGPRSAGDLHVSLQAGELKGQAQGRIDLSELSADLAFAIDTAKMNPRPGLSWDRATLKGRWHGKLETPTAEGHLEVSSLQVPGNTSLSALNADITADRGNVRLRALMKGLRIPGSQPRLLENDPIELDAALRLDDPARRLELTASHRLFWLRGQAVTAGQQSATVEIRLPNVAPFGNYAGQELRGSAAVTAQLDGYPAATRIRLDATAILNPGDQAWAGVVGDRPRLEFSGTFRDAALAIERLKITARALALEASGSIGEKKITGRWTANLSDLSLISSALAGKLQGSGSLDGPPAAFTVDARLGALLSVRGSESGNLNADVKIRGLPSAPTGSVAAQGLLDGAPLHVDLSLEQAGTGSLRAVVHQGDWKSAHAQGELIIGTDSSVQSHGRISLVIGQLKDLQHLTGLDIGGSLTANAVIHPQGPHTQARLQLDAQDVTLDGFAGNMHVAGDGTGEAFAFKAAVEMPELNGAPATVTAAGALNLSARQISLQSARAVYRSENIRLLAPTRVQFADGLKLESTKIGAQNAELDLQGEILPALALHAALRNVDAAAIDAFAPKLLSAGTLEAHADLQGTMSAPQGEIVVHATGLELADDAALGLPPTNVRITARLRGHTADIDAQMQAGTSHLSAVGAAPIALDGAVDLKIIGRLDVGLLNPLLEARGQHASGQMDIDATIAGSVAAPQIGGFLSLTRGGVNDYGRGISLTDITAQLIGSEGALQIKSFTASAAPGSVSVSGSIGVLQPGIPVNLKITAQNARPIVSKLVTANLNADLTIEGTARQRLDVSGNVHLNRTLIGVPNSLPPNVAVLDVRRRGKKSVVVVPDKPLIIGLKLTVQAPNEILVQGRGLDAELGGELRISGTTDAPIVRGAFDLQRGNFTLASSRLNLVPPGRVSFGNAGLKNKIDPTLDFTAQTSIGTTTATVHISGPADAPVFEFSSQPTSLPQDEIMAQLLFGQNIAQLSALQVAQIGYALASLSGVTGNGGLNPLVKIQKSLGLDRLTIGAGTPTATGQDSGASIQAGRYISKRIYIEAKQNTTGTSQLEADVDLTKHLKLQTKLGNGTASVQGTTPDNDPGSSVGLLYQFEY